VIGWVVVGGFTPPDNSRRTTPNGLRVVFEMSRILAFSVGLSLHINVFNIPHKFRIVYELRI
jgi:hypothetical protein